MSATLPHLLPSLSVDDIRTVRDWGLLNITAHLDYDFCEEPDADDLIAFETVQPMGALVAELRKTPKGAFQLVLYALDARAQLHTTIEVPCDTLDLARQTLVDWLTGVPVGE